MAGGRTVESDESTEEWVSDLAIHGLASRIWPQFQAVAVPIAMTET